MSMLAAPRRKQKVINLRAKNSAWSNDPEKFGQRMLEKMGWSSGKGLGAKENGIVEHVVARFKNDEKGLGFEDNNDQWTKHEDDFNALLANLSSDTSEKDKLHSGVSLEVKSKKSKARIHYHKFTRGKDIARYSEKDLANIFGKKTLKDNKSTEETSQDHIIVTEQVFTEKGSMEDYFKSKMPVIKNNKYAEQTSCNTPTDGDENRDDFCAFKGFSQAGDAADSAENNSFDFKSFSFYNQAVKQPSTMKSAQLEKMDDGSKKTKKKKSVNVENVETNVQNDDINVQNDEINLQNDEINVKKAKKNKKRKHNPDTDIDTVVKPEVCIEDDSKIITDCNNEELQIKSKKSKKKKKAQEDNASPKTEVLQKKKDKQKSRKAHELEEVHSNNLDPTTVVTKKKKKKNKDV